MDYSVIIPVYNSEGSLEELSTRLVDFFEHTPPLPSASPPKGEKKPVSYELIFVDDFSIDGSWKILKKLKKQHPGTMKIIRLAKNYGQHNALLCGFQHASGKRTITMDDDLQQAPEEIQLLTQKMDNTAAELVYGVGGNKHSPAWRVASGLYKKGAKHIDGKYDKGSSFRLIDASLLKKIISHKQHFVLIDELLYWYTEFIETVKVSHYPRKTGKTGYSSFGTLKYVVNISVNYSNWPLKFMMYGGAGLSLLSFLLGLYFIFKKLFLDIAVPGFTALIVAIFFSTSLLLLCFGIVGKYLNNIYTILNDKPMFSIKETYL